MFIKTLELFPTVVGDCFRQDLVEPVMKIIDETKDWRLRGSQSNNILTPELKKEFTNEVSNYLSEILKYDNEIVMTTSWIARIDKNTPRNYHCHMNSWWSAVFYCQDDSRLNLENTPTPQIYVRPNEYTRENSDSWTLQANRGSLIIFPSNTLHTSVPYNYEGFRYSIAMNFMPVGLVGEQDSQVQYNRTIGDSW
tara:strand:+ start:1038 stop:1622 length:585 start_codon:yes stop_codon:yes gene_type:complete